MKSEISRLKKECSFLKNDLNIATEHLAFSESEMNKQKIIQECLEAEASKLEKAASEKHKPVEFCRASVDKNAEKFLEDAVKFYQPLRLDNPEILNRYDSTKEELQNLRLEATRLTCENKILQDRHSEIEALIKEKASVKEELKDMEVLLRTKDSSLRESLRSALHYRDRLQERYNQSVQKASADLEAAQKEGQYLESALQAMKAEHRNLSLQLSSQHEGTASSSVGGRASTSSNVSSRCKPSGYTFRSQNRSSQYNEQISTRTRSSREGRHFRMDWHKQTVENRSSRQTDEGSQSSVTPTPSTPRTFTRNPAPPTPQEERGATLPYHLLGHFTCVGSKDDDEEKTDGDESQRIGESSSQDTCVQKEKEESSYQRARGLPINTAKRDIRKSQNSCTQVMPDTWANVSDAPNSSESLQSPKTTKPESQPANVKKGSRYGSSCCRERSVRLWKNMLPQGSGSHGPNDPRISKDDSHTDQEAPVAKSKDKKLIKHVELASESVSSQSDQIPCGVSLSSKDNQTRDKSPNSLQSTASYAPGWTSLSTCTASSAPKALPSVQTPLVGSLRPKDNQVRNKSSNSQLSIADFAPAWAAMSMYSASSVSKASDRAEGRSNRKVRFSEADEILHTQSKVKEK